MDKEELIYILSKVIHPGEDSDIVSLGMVEDVATGPQTVSFTLNFKKARDPFMASVRRAAEALVAEAHPEYAGRIAIQVKEAAPKKVEKQQPADDLGRVKNIIAVASGKGGVGKSTVAAGLARALNTAGYRVGILDADIYGPSMPSMFALEGYVPAAEIYPDGREMIIPAQSDGIKVMSIGFFIKPDDALVWRGAMATSALRQLITQTAWGELDYLLIDLPPGTGDVHLTIVHDMKLTGAIVVTTPQDIALADVVRGIKMFRTEGINVPVMGLVENMSWFTPAELPGNRYYIFGRDGGKDLAEKLNIPLLAQIPLVMSADQKNMGPRVEEFAELAEKIVKN